jgi:hypothetical protein
VKVAAGSLIAASVLLLATVGERSSAAGEEPAALGEGTYNGFSVEGATVPLDEIRPGGPPRDGIRSVDAPGFVPPGEASWVRPPDPVLGVSLGQEAHAYPVHLIERHQVVNDEIEGTPVVVSYDPLAGVPRAFQRKLGRRTLSFGVSGLIHNHGFLLFDRETESLWVPFTGEAIAGELVGKRLEPVRIRQETLAGWLERHPDSRVMKRPMPTQIDYRHSPFTSYIVQDDTIFPVRARDESFHAKELVLGVSKEGAARAYLGSIVTAAGGKVVDEFQGRTVRLLYDTNEGIFSWDIPDDVDVVEAYWLAWKAFHPETEVWSSASPVESAE